MVLFKLGELKTERFQFLGKDMIRMTHVPSGTVIERVVGERSFNNALRATTDEMKEYVAELKLYDDYPTRQVE